MNPIPDLSFCFYQFELNNFQQINSVRINNRLAWYLIKLQLYYLIYHQTINNSSYLSKVKEGKNTGLINDIKRIGLFLILFWKKWKIIKIKSRTQKTIVMPLTVDKRLKGNKYKNILFDELILGGIVKDPLILSLSKEGELLEPSFVKPDAHLDHLSHLTTALSRYKKGKKSYSKEISSLHELVILFLEENKINIDVELNWVSDIISHYLSEYRIYSRIFKILKPHTLVVTDQSFKAKTHAAMDLGVRVFEYQHGLMNEFYPHYTIPDQYKLYREYLVSNLKIVVFGEFHRQQILKHGFWRNEDIIVTGNAEIHEARKHKERNIDNNGILKILFITQGLFNFNKAKLALQQVQKLNPEKFNIIIKPHPNEPEECLNYYRKLVADNLIFNLIEGKVGILDLIITSDIILGFDSTTLLEAIALEKPSITIASDEFPKGIHTMLNSNSLQSAIKIARLEDEELLKMIQNINNDNSLIENWKKECVKWGNYLYDSNYIENSKLLFSENKF